VVLAYGEFRLPRNILALRTLNTIFFSMDQNSALASMIDSLSDLG